MIRYRPLYEVDPNQMNIQKLSEVSHRGRSQKRTGHNLMKVFWFVRAEQGHKSAGDTQFIQLLHWLNVQVYRAKKNVNASNESPQLRVKLRAVAGTVTGAVAGIFTFFSEIFGNSEISSQISAFCSQTFSREIL